MYLIVSILFVFLEMEILIGQQEDFLGAPQGRLRIQKDDVDIIVLKHNGELFAMDSFCYRECIGFSSF